MADFEQFVCWNDEAVVAATPRDAAALSPALFQAVHHPLRMRKRPLGTRIGGRWTTEEALVKVLGGPVRPDGYLLIPVVGGAGTGKSHLVRWAHDRTIGTPGWEVRYLAKNRTSIRKVIQLVIEGQEGEAFDRAREALETAPAQHEGADTLAERLLDELALIVAEPVQHSEEVDARQRQLVDKLAKELPDVLRDPVVRRRLVADGGVVHRLVGLAQEGRRDGDGLDDDAMRISAEDLPLAFEELADASKGAKDLLVKLSSLAKLRTAAVDMMNEALPIAVKRVFVSGQIDLIEVLRDLRRSLHEAGRQLVLFIEDLTVLHGVEEEFLDAMVEPAVSVEDPAAGRLCDLRVLFAVTEHHFDNLDTVSQRCEDAYWLDATVGDGGMSSDEVASFLGRYLNVARLKPGPPLGASVVNACSECVHQPACHATFGRSNEGFGLYPYNRPVIDRLVDAVAPDHFDPRAVVRSLVGRFLLQARPEIQQHEFPSSALMEPFDRATAPLEPIVVAHLDADRHGDQEPVANLARYWAEEPPLVNDDVLSAFGYPALARGGLPRDPRGGPGPGPGPGPRSRPDPEHGPAGLEHRLPAAERKAYVALTAWAGGTETLSVASTRLVRTLVHTTVIRNLDDGATPVNLGSEFEKERFRPNDVLVERSDTVQTNDRAVVRLEPSAELATALQGLILLKEGIVDERTTQFRPYAAWATEKWVAAVAAHLAEQQTDGSVVAAVEGLVVCAVLAGNVQIGDNPAVILGRIFESPPAPPASDSPGVSARSKPWSSMLEVAAKEFPELDRRVRLSFGESRGAAGGVRAVHADALVPVIANFTKAWRLESPDLGVQKLMHLVEPAVETEWGALRTRVEGSLDHVDLERPWHDQAATALELLLAASAAGHLPDGEALPALEAMRLRSSERAHVSLAKARDAVAADPPFLERLALLTSAVPDDVAAVADFVRRATTALDGLESELAPDGPKPTSDGDLAGVVTLVLDGTAAFQAAVEGLAQ
jgi:hypothetical protein